MVAMLVPLIPRSERYPLHPIIGEVLRPDRDELPILPLQHVVLRALRDVLAGLVELEAPASASTGPRQPGSGRRRCCRCVGPGAGGTRAPAPALPAAAPRCGSPRR